MTSKEALGKLRKARSLDLKATKHALDACDARARFGSYSRREELSERFANEAAALFLQVEHFLESQ